jgi:hypothetical protein
VTAGAVKIARCGSLVSISTAGPSNWRQTTGREAAGVSPAEIVGHARIEARCPSRTA